MPERSNPYLVPSWPKTSLNRDLWNSVFGDVDNRLGSVEQKAASFAALEAQGIQASLDYIQANVAQQLVTLQHSITLAQDQIEQITIGGKIPNALLPERLRAYPEYVADWNNVRESGLYFGGPDTLNTPAQPYVFVGDIEARESAYVVQRLTAVGINNPALNVKFERQIVNNVPSTWARVRDTEAELDTRYNRLSQPVANSQLPDRLKDFGRVVIDWNAATESGVYFGETATNRPDGIDGGLIGHVEAATNNAIIQTVTRWWQAWSTNSATWRRYKNGTGLNDWSPWFRVRFTEGELDERYNRISQTISNSQLPGTQTYKLFSGTGLAGGIGIRNTTANRDYRILQKDNGNFEITDETAGAARMAITPAGALAFYGPSLFFNGNAVRTAADAYAKSETYSQAETRSLVTTARQVRLGGLGEIGTTTFQWNEAPAGSVLTGVFVDGNWGVRNVRYRAIHQTDLSGNWVTVAQA